MTPRTFDEMLADCVEEGDCLLWQGRLTSTGHPHYSGHGERGLVRRALWKQQHGWLPDDTKTVITTSCMQPLCVQRGHLLCMTRSKLIARSYGHRNLAAEYGKRQAAVVRAGRTKLNLAVARQIRCDERTHGQVAEALGVSASLVAKIRQGQIWREPFGVFSSVMR